MTSKQTVPVTKMNNKQNSLNRPIIRFVLDFMVSRKLPMVNTFPDKLVFYNQFKNLT